MGMIPRRISREKVSNIRANVAGGRGLRKNGHTRLLPIHTISRSSASRWLSVRVHSHGHLRSPLPVRWYVYYHTSPAWVTIDRLRSGRDIRLSTATMRALNSRRPQLTSTFCLFPRSFFCLLLLLFVLHGIRARSVPRDEEGLAQPEANRSAVEDKANVELTKVEDSAQPEPVQGKLLTVENDGAENEKVQPEEPGDIEGKISQPEIGNKLQEAGKTDDQPVDQSSRNNSVASLQEFDAEKEKAKKSDEAEASSLDNPGALKQDEEDASVAKKRRRNDVALVGKSDVQGSEGISVEQIGKAQDEGIRRFDVQVDADGAAPSQENAGDVVNDTGARKRLVEAQQATEDQVNESKQSPSELVPEKSQVKAAEETKEEIPGYFRKSVIIEDSDEEKEKISSDGDREFRYLDGSTSKSRRKSSTVYLNAEEKKIPDGEQQSIVEGQIKKLISIRDDALDAQHTDKLDEAKVLNSKREVGMDEVAFTQENVQTEVKNKVKDIKLVQLRRSLGSNSIFKKWREQAVTVQEQIKNRSFPLRSKEQAAEVLPGIPKFTENQLLATLEQIVSLKESDDSNVSYLSFTKDLGLTDNQLRIIKCAEQLVAVRERQSFVANMVECIRGLSVFNCIKVFVWPIVMNNLPESVSQSFDNLPIEVNLFDLFQANKEKSGRAQNLHQVKLITPETLVYNILQDALESYPSDETLVSYVNPENETLRELLTSNQLSIIQMAEKLLPLTLRQDYSDKMFSCVRRFEYFSCIKYFAWPMIKQYFPALPAFPDYQSWYPVVDWYPQYPILPFPSPVGDIGELPEVVDADATRNRRPRPEVLIIRVLQNTLKEQPRISASTSFLDRSGDSYAALIPQDQLLTINMAEQLIPVSYRPEFVQKTVNCMKEYNYLTCIKYSTWPTVRQFIPTLPDISGLLPDFQVPGISDIFSYVPEIPNFPDLSSYWPITGSSDQQAAGTPTFVLLKNRPEVLQSSNEQEIKIIDTLLKIRESLSKSSGASPPFTLTGNAITFATLTKSQLDILRLAECLIPPAARPALVTEVIVYLQRNDNFIDCVRYVMWPTIARYVSNLPEFPIPESRKQPANLANAQEQLEAKATAINEQTQERVVSGVEPEKPVSTRIQDKESQNNGQQNVPVISVTGTRFVPLFTEHPESVIFNILRSVQLQSLNLNRATTVPTIKNQEIFNYITVQQQSIVNIVDSLLPQSIRTEFADKLITCLKINNFIICSRDVIWPTLLQYFPWLPAFPNFGTLLNSPSNDTTSNSSKQNLTESNADNRPLAETDVTTGVHGDTTVTITDTRFFPIFNEMPESVILNILKSVQLTLPNLQSAPVPTRTQEFASFLTEQQINIVQIAENLLPISLRPSYISKFTRCMREKNFLECTRDVTWPTIAQTYPFLPSFPNFGGYQNTPRIRFQVFLSEKSPNLGSQAAQDTSNQKTEALLLQEAEERIENILMNSLEKSSPKLERSYLDDSTFAFPHLTKRQEHIIKLVELGIPDSARATFVEKMLECTKGYNFVACTQSISWPTLKEYVPSLPDFSNINDLVSPLLNVPQVSLESFPTVPVQNVPGIAEYPGGLSQTPDRISQLADGIPQVPTFSQYPGYFGQGASGGQLFSRSGVQGASAITPSVGNEGTVPGYAGQPPGIFLDISKEKVQIPDAVQRPTKTEGSKSRKRRSIELSNTYYGTDGSSKSSSSSSLTVPNITESEYLQLLIQIRETARAASDVSPASKKYYVDSLNFTIRNSLTADQYEILKVVDDLDQNRASRGLAQQVIQCITGLSFIRCLGIFIWPLIVSNLPSFPSFGILGRSLDTEHQVQEFFGMSTEDFEKELLTRKESIEHFLVDWYQKLVDDKFQTNVGFLKIRGYGNGELGISFSGFREGRGAKLKDSKNLPSILTIISDIMEEVLDQRPDGEKPKKEKEKREKSIDVSREADIQFLKDSEEYVDIKRSMNDDEIITMFLDKIKSNDSDADGDGKYFGLEDAYNAFGVLFGPRLHSRLTDKLQNLNHQLRSLEGSSEADKEVDIVSLEGEKDGDSDEPKVLSLKSQVTYDLEKESSRDQEEKQRQKRAKNLFKSFLDKHSNKYLKESVVERLDDVDENKIIGDERDQDRRTGLIVKLPRLNDEIVSRKMTSSMVHLGKAMRDKMMQMMPGVGLVLSFLLQMAVAHARAAASMAGVLSNMAMGSAIIGMIRDSFFGGNNNPQIKYVYDNNKVGSGVSWPVKYGSDSHYRGL
ncbi:uncharacterized protein LOC143344619 [Colletes latitarsis]|uniref:uncharacterized protein LOC143344619 n=1 Tax=Colletes latitarsis TaxID=2605962 RepID=UPI0040374B67